MSAKFEARMDRRNEAAARVLALEVGALSPQQVARWADALIATEEEIDPRLTDVSLAKTPAEAISALNAFGPAPDQRQAAALVFGFFHEALVSGQADHRKVAKALYDMATDDDFPVPGLVGPMWCFLDDLELAIAGVHDRSPDEIKAEMERFLSEANL